MNFIGIKPFLIMETVLYLSFLCLDISSFSAFSGYLKYISILMLSLFVCIKSLQMGKSMLIPTALAFSAFADLFLLFTENYLPGVLAFLAVQIILCARVHQLFKLHLFYQLTLVLLLFAAVIDVLLLLGFSLNVVTILALLYFVCFFSNVAMAVYGLLTSRDGNGRTQYFFALGLVLFFLCDIHVGMNNGLTYAPQLGTLFQKYREWISFAMWFFYLPGQTLIGLSNLFSFTLVSEVNATYSNE